jgi:hypothetical protein
MPEVGIRMSLLHAAHLSSQPLFAGHLTPYFHS